MDYTLNPYTLLTPDSETKEVTSELIMMHESFLRTKTTKLIPNINNICFYIGHSKITTPPHKTLFNQIRNGEKEIR